MLCAKLRQVGWNQLAHDLEHLGQATNEGAGLTIHSEKKMPFCWCFVVFFSQRGLSNCVSNTIFQVLKPQTVFNKLLLYVFQDLKNSKVGQSSH